MKFNKYFFCLGNPGAQYAKSPHNLGFLFADRLMHHFPTIPHQNTKLQDTCTCIVKDNLAILVSKPKTFMNLSGQAVMEIYNGVSAGNALDFAHKIVVAHDEGDLKDGEIKLKDGRLNGGHRGHNGLRNIGEQLGYMGLNKEHSVGFWRIRIGCKKQYDGQLSQYVLQNMSTEEWQEWENRIDKYISSADFNNLLLN